MVGGEKRTKCWAGEGTRNARHLAASLSSASRSGHRGKGRVVGSQNCPRARHNSLAAGKSGGQGVFNSASLERAKPHG